MSNSLAGRCSTIVLGALAFAGVLPAPSRAASIARQISAIYQPVRIEDAALAPDGRHVAFAIRENRGIEVHVVSVESLAVRARVPIDVRAGAQLRLFAWCTADRLIAMSDQPVIVAVTTTGQQTTLVTDGTQLLARPKERPLARPEIRALGMLAEDPEIMLLEVGSLVEGGMAPSTITESNLGPGEAMTLENRPRIILGRHLPPERWIDLVQLDTRTGERRFVFSKDVNRAGASLIADRQGRPRVLLERGVLPQRFRYRPANAKLSGWRMLDRIGTELVPTAFSITPANFLGHRAIPLGFGFDPDLLYYASNLERDTYAIHTLNVSSGKQATLVHEDETFDLVSLDRGWEVAWSDRGAPLVFDRRRKTLVGIRAQRLETETRWLDPDLAAVHETLCGKFPRRSVQILDWDDARERFLALISTNGDPGRYFIYERAGGKCVEFGRRAPALDPDHANRSDPFVFETSEGVKLTGYVTVPHAPPVAKPAIVVWMHDGPWDRIMPGFDRDAQALAAMGFLVLQINYRGSAGMGVRHRESIRKAFDRAPLDDARAALAWVQTHYACDSRRTGIVGVGYGGYLALRALQLQPEAFRAGAGINGVTDLDQFRRSETEAARWRRSAERKESLMAASMAALENGASDEPIDFDRELRRWFCAEPLLLTRFSVISDAARLVRPVFLLHDPGNRLASVEAVRELRDKLARLGQEPVYGELPPNFVRGDPFARATVLRRIGEFLNLKLYDFDVKIGELTEKE